jgi:hypothetical protein
MRAGEAVGRGDHSRSGRGKAPPVQRAWGPAVGVVPAVRMGTVRPLVVETKTVAAQRFFPLRVLAIRPEC